MLKELNDCVSALWFYNTGRVAVTDETLDLIDGWFNSINKEQLNNYETIAYNELSDRLWLAYTK